MEDLDASWTRVGTSQVAMQANGPIAVARLNGLRRQQVSGMFVKPNRKQGGRVKEGEVRMNMPLECQNDRKANIKNGKLNITITFFFGTNHQRNHPRQRTTTHKPRT